MSDHRQRCRGKLKYIVTAAALGALMFVTALLFLLFPGAAKPGWAQAASRCGARVAIEAPKAQAEQDRKAVAAARPKFIIVTVRDGDSLWKIAHDYLGDGAKAGAIARMNHIAQDAILPPGKEIAIPWPG